MARPRLLLTGVGLMGVCGMDGMQRTGLAARSAGGGKGADRGKSTSALGGEQLKLDVDASCHTAVQRSWLYGGDAGLAAAVNVRGVSACLSLCSWLCALVGYSPSCERPV